MKKVILITALLLSLIQAAKAENDTVFYVSQFTGNFNIEVCSEKYDHVVIYANENCNSFVWFLNDLEEHFENPIVLSENCNCEYVGCGEHYTLRIFFESSNVPNSTTSTTWKHQNTELELEPVTGYNPIYEMDSIEMYDFLWSTGETTPTIEVMEAGIYICYISDQCGIATSTFIVQDNVEISLATCDLETNHNMVTWPVTAAQAQYIDHLRIIRDGMEVGTANYSDGFFLDAIGSDAASRTYTLIAVATDGTECPIVSYPKETIHMAYLTGINNTIEVNWNVPTGYDLLGYNICEWHEDDGSLSVIDFVGASVTSYTCSQSQFDEGYIVVQGVEAGKDGETRLLSNRSLDLVGLGENEAMAFKVYPNPAKDRFIVEGTGTMTVTNTLGQTILAREIDGKETVELPQGMYFVKLGGATRKVVVE